MEESNQHYLWFLIIIILFLFAGTVFIFNKNKPANSLANLKEEKINYGSKVYTVFYTKEVFSPTNLQINVGDTVRFKNDSLFSVRIVSDPHPLHNDLPGFDSVSEIPSQGIFSFTFTKRGIFGYHNEKKPDQAGTIIVK